MSSYKLSLGPEIVQRLMPHRRPYLMVDRIVSFSSEPAPCLRTVKYLSVNEPFFDGHFPRIALMPGAMSFEGLGQTAHLLAVICALRDGLLALGSSEQELFDGLANVEYGYTLNPAFKPEKAGDFNRIVDKLAASSYGMVGAAHLKFLEPVFPGNPVEFEAALSGTFDDYQNFQVEAFVNCRTKVKGTLSSIKGMGVSSMLDVRDR